MPSTKPDHGALLDVLTPIVALAGFDVEDLIVTNVGRRCILRIVIDSDDGVDLDAVALVSRAISDELDARHDADIDGPYQLEVSSPGVDRPLTTARQWRRALGRLVNVTVDGVPAAVRVLAAGPDSVTLSIDGRTREVGWASLGAGKVQLEFNRAGASADRDVADGDDLAEEG